MFRSAWTKNSWRRMSKKSKIQTRASDSKHMYRNRTVQEGKAGRGVGGVQTHAGKNLHTMPKRGNKAIGLSGWRVKSKMVMVLGMVL